MRLKRLKLENIRSYSSQEIEFPDGSTLLSGEVGSGKTSILLAVEYALFGLQPGQKGSSLLRNGANEGKVLLEMEIDNNKIIIERSLIRSSRAVVNDYSAITVNGRKEEYSITELKTKVLQLLCYPQEFIKKTNLLYRYTVYTPQEQMKQIILEDPEVRLNIIRHVFGIDKYKKIRENLIILLTKLKEDGKILQGEIKTLDEDRNVLASTLAFISSLEIKIGEKAKELESDVQSRKKIEKEAEELSEKIKEKNKFENEVEKARLLMGTKRESLTLLDKERDEINRNMEKDKERFKEEDYLAVIKSLRDNNEQTVKINNEYIEIVGKIRSFEEEEKISLEKKNRVFQIDICPTCLQDVPDAHKHNILNETETKLATLKSNIIILKTKSDELKKKIAELADQKIALEKQKLKLDILKSKAEYVDNSRKRLVEIEKQRENLDKDLFLLSKHVNNLKEAILQFSKFDNLNKIKQEELKEAFRLEKNTEISLAELKKEREMTLKEVGELEKRIGKKEESRQKLNKILETMDWLSSNFLGLVEYVERSVLSKVRQEFSSLFSKWFYVLAGDSFMVQLDENFTPLIMQDENEMDYSFLSGGERTSVALAYRLALNQTINSILSRIKTKEIVILDEPTEGFSEAQINKIRDVLTDIRAKQLIIVSHEQKIEGFVDNVIKITKERGDSEIG